MREIKFRVWCEFEVDGELHISMESPASWFLLTQGGKLWSCAPLISPQPLGKEYKKAIPLFYTGLKDKNGKEIYEGDVIKFWHNAFDFEGIGILAKVIFMASAFRFEYGGNAIVAHSVCEIVGNVYENPELLKKE